MFSLLRVVHILFFNLWDKVRWSNSSYLASSSGWNEEARYNELDHFTLSQRLKNKIWTTLNKETIKVSDMKNKHLINSYKMVKRNNDVLEDSAYGYGEKWEPILAEEIIRRFINENKNTKWSPYGIYGE